MCHCRKRKNLLLVWSGPQLHEFAEKSSCSFENFGNSQDKMRHYLGFRLSSTTKISCSLKAFLLVMLKMIKFKVKPCKILPPFGWQQVNNLLWMVSTSFSMNL